MITMRTRLLAAASVVLLSGAAAPAVARPADVLPVPAATALSTGVSSIHLSSLSRGARPGVAYIRGTHLDFEVGDYTLERPDGTSLRLPRASWSEWAPMGRGAIGTFGTEAGPEVQVVTGSGRVTSSFVPHFGLAVSPDRTIVGWLLGRLNTPHVVEGGGSRTFDLPQIGHGLAIGTISGEKTCKEQAPEGGGCTVIVNTAGDRGVWVSTSHGIVAEVHPMRSVTDINPGGQVVGRTADEGGHPCSAMWGIKLGQRWRTCDARLVSFAPDGGHVLGTGSVDHRSGEVHRVALYDDSGALHTTYVARHGDHIDQVEWEDSTHVLATVFELGSSSSCPGACRGRWAIVRLGLDGSAELATPAVRGRIDYRAWSLPLT
jgi:hypothetical protein